MKLLISIILILLFHGVLSAQLDTSRVKNDSIPDRFFLLQNVERNGVSLPEAEIKEVTILGRPTFTRKNEFRRYERLIYNVKRVYPYAVLVRIKMEEVSQELGKLTSNKERREYLSGIEKEVFGEYEDDMRQMTITQGRLLIKLIDRETQNTSYTLIREYRGWFSAAFWQGIARIFGSNLKDEYDAYGEDVLIELIIREIDAGRL